MDLNTWWLDPKYIFLSTVISCLCICYTSSKPSIYKLKKFKYGTNRLEHKGCWCYKNSWKEFKWQTQCLACLIYIPLIYFLLSSNVFFNGEENCSLEQLSLTSNTAYHVTLKELRKKQQWMAITIRRMSN